MVEIYAQLIENERKILECRGCTEDQIKEKLNDFKKKAKMIFSEGKMT